MSKSRVEKRRRKMQKKRSRNQPSPKSQAGRPAKYSVPSAQTMWRIMHLDFRVQDKLVETTMDVQPSLWNRDANKIQKIEQAADIEAVLDLAPAATGLAGYAWPKRMRDFGPGAANNIVARLNSDWMRRHAKERTGIQERCIGALRWCEGRAGDALTSCWDSLDDYGRSLACIVLGLLGVQQAADQLWAFYQKTRALPQTLFVGALWGLIDLGDSRAADALVDMIVDKRVFYEKFGFLSRAGDRRVVVPLMSEVIFGAEETQADAMWALTGVAHRLGRDDLYEELRDGTDAQETDSSQIESFVDRVFRYSQEDVEKHFETFYDIDARSLLTLAKRQGYQH